jgi:hypothetical protein
LRSNGLSDERNISLRVGNLWELSNAKILSKSFKGEFGVDVR